MKRLAYLLADFPVLSETFIGNEIRAMEAHGHAVLPIVFNRRHGPAQPEDIVLAERSTLLNDMSNGLPGLFFPRIADDARAMAFIRDQKLLPGISLAYQGLRIAAFLKRSNIQHIHAHFAGGAAAHAIVAAKLAGITVSFVCHGHDVYGEPEDLEAKLRHADFVVSVCRDLSFDLLAFERSARIVDVPCGTNPSRFTPSPVGGHNGKLLFLGRLVEQKGMDDLLTALSILPKDTCPALDIVGDGPCRAALEAQVAALGLDQVSFLGAKPAAWFAEHGPRYLGLAAPFKVGPGGVRDTGPLVVKEAMAMGVPVVSTAFMGVKETVTPETGWLVPAAVPAALAEALVALINQTPEARATMGAAARARIETHFTLERSAALLSQAIEQL